VEQHRSVPLRAPLYRQIGAKVLVQAQARLPQGGDQGCVRRLGIVGIDAQMVLAPSRPHVQQETVGTPGERIRREQRAVGRRVHWPLHEHGHGRLDCADAEAIRIVHRPGAVQRHPAPQYRAHHGIVAVHVAVAGVQPHGTMRRVVADDRGANDHGVLPDFGGRCQDGIAHVPRHAAHAESRLNRPLGRLELVQRRRLHAAEDRLHLAVQASLAHETLKQVRGQHDARCHGETQTRRLAQARRLAAAGRQVAKRYVFQVALICCHAVRFSPQRQE